MDASSSTIRIFMGAGILPGVTPHPRPQASTRGPPEVVGQFDGMAPCGLSDWGLFRESACPAWSGHETGCGGLISTTSVYAAYPRRRKQPERPRPVPRTWLSEQTYPPPPRKPPLPNRGFGVWMRAMAPPTGPALSEPDGRPRRS